MGYSSSGEERFESYILATVVGVQRLDFAVEFVFNQGLKGGEYVPHLRLELHRVQPRVSRVVIDKDNIILVVVDRSNG